MVKTLSCVLMIAAACAREDGEAMMQMHKSSGLVEDSQGGSGSEVFVNDGDQGATALLVSHIALSSNLDQGLMAVDLVDKGGAGCKHTSTCEMCQGDCDKDVDCQGQLRCFQRDTSAQLVPGCNPGGAGDIPTHDYCFQPQFPSDLDLVSKGGAGCKHTSTCEMCQGDCDADVDCKGQLRCFQRGTSAQHVPGCNPGGAGDIPTYDYCFQPQFPSDLDLVSKGGAGCKHTSTCEMCQGDCDADVDCKGHLQCFQRSNSAQHVPGCNPGGGGDVPTYDYCYDPLAAR